MRSLRSLALLFGAAVLAACGEKNAAQNISAPIAGAAVKFFNFGVNDPSVNFWANEQKLTAGSYAGCSSAADGTPPSTDTVCVGSGRDTVGTKYGATANGSGLYSSVTPGAYTLSGRISGVSNHNAPISNTSTTIESGKFYSYYLSGIYDAGTKSVEAFVVEDPLPDLDLTKTYVRFVNAISNSQPMTLYAKNSTSGDSTAIGAAVAYKAAGAFVSIPPANYDLTTRVGGSNAAVITRKAVAFNAGRVYTVTAYGDITATTGTNKPALDNTANR